MNRYLIEIKWEGPHSTDFVIAKMNKGGSESNGYSGSDYGLYQIYGNHILSGQDTLLYVGKATRQTFSGRFRQHKNEWLDKEKNIKIYVGRINDSKKYPNQDNWRTWEDDVEAAEKIIIYKYTPNYNSSEIGDEPRLHHKQIWLIHKGRKHNIRSIDRAPKDYT